MFNKDTNPDEFDKIFAVYPGNPGRKPFWVTIIDTTMDTRPEHESFETWEKLFEGLNVLVNSAKIKSCVLFCEDLWEGLGLSGNPVSSDDWESFYTKASKDIHLTFFKNKY